MRPASWLGDLGSLLLPPGCVACGRWMPEGREAQAPLTCGTCRSRLAPAPWPRCPRCHFPTGTGRVTRPDCRECRTWGPHPTRARYAFLLRPPADDLVHGLKYEGWTKLAPEMAGPMAAALDGVAVDCVVPVPTTARRLAQRGYNQAGLLADAVARRLGTTALEALSRTRNGPTQVALPPSRRRANVKGAFAAHDPSHSAVHGAHVVLVDDVLTTGSTAAEAASRLARMGARSVTLVTFARAMPYRRSSGR